MRAVTAWVTVLCFGTQLSCSSSTGSSSACPLQPVPRVGFPLQSRAWSLLSAWVGVGEHVPSPASQQHRNRGFLAPTISSVCIGIAFSLASLTAASHPLPFCPGWLWVRLPLCSWAADSLPVHYRQASIWMNIPVKYVWSWLTAASYLSRLYSFFIYLPPALLGLFYSEEERTRLWEFWLIWEAALNLFVFKTSSPPPPLHLSLALFFFFPLCSCWTVLWPPVRMAVCHSLMIAAMCSSPCAAPWVLPQSKRDSLLQSLSTVVPCLMQEIMLSSDSMESQAFNLVIFALCFSVQHEVFIWHLCTLLPGLWLTSIWQMVAISTWVFVATVPQPPGKQNTCLCLCGGKGKSFMRAHDAARLWMVGGWLSCGQGGYQEGGDLTTATEAEWAGACLSALTALVVKVHQEVGAS